MVLHQQDKTNEDLGKIQEGLFVRINHIVKLFKQTAPWVDRIEHPAFILKMHVAS